MSIRRNPFEEIEQLFERLGRQFEEASESWEHSDPSRLWSSGRESMAVDLVEHDEELVAKIDLPGFTSEEVTVRVTDHTLEIDAERETATEDADEAYLKRERRHKSMHRSIRLPREIDPDRVTARMHNGMLTLTLPKLQVESAKQIDIE